MVVNPHILLMFKNDNDRIANIISKDYETWIVQDQSLFTWILSTISEVVLPHVLLCKNTYEFGRKMHKHFHSQIKICVHQLRL